MVRAGSVLPPMIRDAAQSLRITDETTAEILGDALIRAYTAGAQDADERNCSGDLRADHAALDS